MYLFDRVEEKNIDGTFKVFAINEQDNQMYLLKMDAIISAPESTVERMTMSISCFPEKYIYRGSFKSAIEMKNFADDVLQLLTNADRKNNAIPRA